MISGPRHLGRLELGSDQVAAAIVPQRCREMQRRDAERVPNSTIIRALQLRASM
jgi:hypothetical protein